MRFSLSAKLALLLMSSLICVLFPALTITYIYVGERALQADNENFLGTLRVLEENINAGFLNLNETKLEEVMWTKKMLRSAAQRFSRLVTEDIATDGLPAGLTEVERSRILTELRREVVSYHAKEEVLLDYFLPSSLEQEPQTKLGLRPELTNFKRQSLGKTVARLSSAGQFDIYRLPGHGPMLVYFLPANEWVVVCAISIQSLDDEAEKAANSLMRALQERFRSLSLYPRGFIALLDDSGANLAVNGVFGLSEQSSLAPLFKQARAFGAGIQKSVLRIKRADGTEEEYLVAMGFSRPFRWFTVMAAPLAEISASSRALLKKLTILSLSLGLAALLLSLLMLRRAIRPLRLLLPKLTALPDMDFSSPQAEASWAGDLPLHRRDEVGDLARSFAAMGERLHLNIRALMESSAMQERMQGELDAAREIQRGILPPPELAPNIFGFSSSAMLEPAREVGGDLYYFFTLPDGRYAFIIGDVSGKGVPAALFMSITVTMARYTLTAESDPGAALSRINALLESHNPQTMFVTLFMALYDPASGRLDYANGGHNPPLLLNGNDISFLEGISGPMVGVIPDAHYQTFSCTLQEGELCLLYTDGVTEAVNEAGETFSEERLQAYLAAHGAKHPKDLLSGIFADVTSFRGRAAPFDDITMLAFARRRN
jgi:sigma-B regulation protein RsbU (phosphoserine phosphatase)